MRGSTQVDRDPSVSNSISQEEGGQQRKEHEARVGELKVWSRQDTGQKSGGRQSGGALRSCSPGQGATLLNNGTGLYCGRPVASSQAPALTAPCTHTRMSTCRGSLSADWVWIKSRSYDVHKGLWSWMPQAAFPVSFTESQSLWK